MLKNYDFVSEKTLAYFGKRLTQAPRDADFALAYVREYAATAKEQGVRARCAAVQVQRAVGAARRAAPCLCRAGRHHTTRRLDAGPCHRGVTSSTVIASRRRGNPGAARPLSPGLPSAALGCFAALAMTALRK